MDCWITHSNRGHQYLFLAVGVSLSVKRDDFIKFIIYLYERILKELESEESIKVSEQKESHFAW